MKCFVTGASGFIGANLVHELVARRHTVKALLRPESDVRGLDGVKFERVTGDLLDRKALEHGMENCDWCFHVAASYQLWMRNYKPMYQANVEGTRNVLEAAGKAGCRRIVYTSTVGCIGLPEKVNGKFTPTDEMDIATEAQMTNHYKRSKFQAETVAAELFRKQGLPIVIVNPTAPIGPRDVKPTPTGQVIVDFLNHKLPAFLDTGLNWVHVRDVAIGHILAAEKGRLGDRYILGNAEGNWTMQQMLLALEEITGIRAPRLKVPHWVALAAAHVDEGISFFTGKPPKAPLAGVRMAKYKMWFNPGKAINQLDLPQTSPKQALSDAVEWFRTNGYVGK
ncbi:MAG: NAD-dependent epimerase/dehydratase family protein [Verrucomicrobiales bacterium]|nr:NAD-dependent epimerase/dehydratase family protein [Verrucomicrobiales bacterium]